MILLCVIFLIKGLTVEEAYAEVNGPILMIIAGAIALGSAMQETNLAQCMANGIVSFTQPMGNFALLTGMYFATVAIGMVLNNAATVAIMGQIGISIVKGGEADIELGQLCLLITFAASACFMTPYGYQTNTFVADAVGYSWGEFIKFGAPLQIVHCVMIVALVPWLETVSPGSDVPKPPGWTMANSTIQL
jgi:di/tricarboxylate transporter